MSSIKDKAQGLSSSLTAQDVRGLAEQTGNIYLTLNVIGKRARQLGNTLKSELNTKLKEFAVTADSIEEITENKEQIEISKFYERLPNAAMIATHEFNEDDLIFEKKDREIDEADAELE